MRSVTPRLQLVEASKTPKLTPEQEELLERISDPVTRAVTRCKMEHGVERDWFTLHGGSRG